MNDKNTILIVAAHPDDEVLGCGGVMARLIEEEHRVHILILAEGLTSREQKRNRESKKKELSELAHMARNSASVLGVSSIELMDFPDNRMDSIDMLDIIKIIEKKIEEFQPSIIFTHFGNDLNIDHRITHNAVVTACRTYPNQAVKELYFFEVPSSTEWQFGNSLGFFPNLFFPLPHEQMEKKKKALSFYKSELRPFPHPRSLDAVEALAKWRGASCGFAYAEGFMVGRIIV